MRFSVEIYKFSGDFHGKSKLSSFFSIDIFGILVFDSHVEMCLKLLSTTRKLCLLCKKYPKYLVGQNKVRTFAV